jgi:pimeloyl-ACP methyl ester carboxylesterase
METLTSADGTTIAFDQLGSGPALVLVAGASCDRAVDAGLAQGLAAHFTVLNYDRRGRGDSTDTPPYDVRREVEDLDAVLAAAGGSPVVVGLSSGGGLAALAAAEGLPIGHLVMWEPPYLLDDAGQQAAREYNADLAVALADGRRADAMVLFLRLVGVPEEAIAGMRQSPYWAKGEALAPTLAYDAAVMGDGRVPTDLLGRITVPTSVLSGGASPAWMRESAAAAAAAIPGARSAVLPGQTHDVAPDALATAVRDALTAYADRP